MTKGTALGSAHAAERPCPGMSCPDTQRAGFAIVSSSKQEGGTSEVQTFKHQGSLASQAACVSDLGIYVNPQEGEDLG